MEKLKDEILKVEQVAGGEASAGEGSPGRENLSEKDRTVNRKQEKGKWVELQTHSELELGGRGRRCRSLRWNWKTKLDEKEAARIGSRWRHPRWNRKQRELVELEAIGEAAGGTRSWRNSGCVTIQGLLILSSKAYMLNQNHANQLKLNVMHNKTNILKKKLTKKRYFKSVAPYTSSPRQTPTTHH